MNKKAIRVICALVVISMAFCFMFSAYADHELPPITLTKKTTSEASSEPSGEPSSVPPSESSSESSSECEHSYMIIQYYNDTVRLRCSKCSQYENICFSDHLGDTDCDELDVVPDGIINAKDYAYLMKTYS